METYVLTKSSESIIINLKSYESQENAYVVIKGISLTLNTKAADYGKVKKLLDKNTILADKEYKVNNIIQATGSEPKNIENLEFDNEFILSSNNLLELKSLPKSILIIGSGAIGIEWARIFSNFGVKVTIVEIAERLIPTADIEISKRIERIFKQNNIKYTSTNYHTNKKQKGRKNFRPFCRQIY